MTASQFSAIFVSALFSYAVIKLWLAWRQLDHVAAHRAEVPPAFRDKIALAAHQKAAEYTTALVRFGVFSVLFETLLLLALTLGGGIQLLSTGIIGEYLGRVYDEVKRRPPWVVAATAGLDARVPDL